jgi:lysophospholipase L1-like esterase
MADIAIGKTAVASTAASPAASAVDGNSSTAWRSTGTGVEWIYADLGFVSAIERVKITWGEGYAEAYSVQVSSDLTNWATIWATAAGTGGVDDLGVAGSGRYVRVNATRLVPRAGNYSIWGFEVHSGSPFADLRRCAAAARFNNPLTRPLLRGSLPWIALTVYTAGQIVSNGGKCYICTTGGTSAASGGPAGYITGAAGIVDATVTWAYYGPQTAPAIFRNAAADNAMTVITRTNTMLVDGTGPIRFGGGIPLVNPNSPSDAVVMRQANISSGAGVAFTDYNYYGHFYEAIIEGDKFQVGIMALAQAVNVIIDGQYIDVPIDQTTATGAHTFDFTNVVDQSGGGVTYAAGRSRRHFRFELRNSGGLRFIRYLPVNKMYYPASPDNFVIAVVGDSQVTAQNVSSAPAGSYAIQLAKYLGLPEAFMCAISGTGFVTAGTAKAYGGHVVSDLQAMNAIRPIRYIVIQSSINDNGEATLQAAALTFFAAVRAAFPGVPVFVTGPTIGGNYTSANTLATETAVFAAADQRVVAGDTLIFKIPTVSDVDGMWITGEGDVGAPLGTGSADFNILADGIHLNAAGETLWARRLADAILRIAHTNP